MRKLFGFGRQHATLLTAALLAFMFVSLLDESADSQVVIGGNDRFRNRGIGGVSIDPEGVLSKLDRRGRADLSALRRRALQQVPADFREPAPMRCVSLKGLIANIQALNQDERNRLPDHVQYLAGLTRVRYVFVYPERNDLVLAGPAEGWMVDPAGDIVGTHSGKAILHLDDLLVGLRMAASGPRGSASVSIEPTPEGQRALREYTRTLRSIGNPRKTLATIQERFGPQQIILRGVSDTTRFARVLVAADYQLKRLAMGHDSAPVKGMPSFIAMVKSPRQLKSMSPRWWITDNYEAIHTDGAGLAWELRGAGLKVMTEDDFVTAEGKRVGSGKVNPIAQRWADNMTAKMEDVAREMPIFAELRNCMDLSVVAALIVGENLPTKAGLDIGPLLDENAVVTGRYQAPQTVPALANVIKKRSGYVITVSGGVEVDPWKVVANREKTDSLAPVRAQSIPSDNKWWWQ